MNGANNSGRVSSGHRASSGSNFSLVQAGAGEREYQVTSNQRSFLQGRREAQGPADSLSGGAGVQQGTDNKAIIGEAK